MSTIESVSTAFGPRTSQRRNRARAHVVLGLALVLGITALLPASRAAAQGRTPTHVACVGDSITAGLYASSAAASYPSVLQTLFGTSVQVRNFGHSGATMMSVADLPYQNQVEYMNATTFVSGAGAGAVVDVIIMLGTNDSKPYNWIVGNGTRAQQFVTDCTAMVDHFASLPTHPLVYLALPSHSFTNGYTIDGTIIHDQMLPLIRQVAAAKGLPVIDVDTPTAPHPELFPDGVHPNDVGYALIAQVMHDGLLQPLPAGTDGGAGDTHGAGGTGAGGAGAGGTGAGGTGAGGTGGASTDAGQPDAVVSGAGGSGTGGSPAGADAGTSPAGGSGCSCRLSAGRHQESGGAGLLLAALAFFSLRSRRRPR
jgi:lysophospholipase L1-like esterase